LQNPLQALLDLSQHEKIGRGLEHTPHEIWQQPDTWKTTYRRCQDLQNKLKEKLHRAGIGLGNVLAPIVYLVGAGTSDYTGRALAPLMRKQWGCEVWPIPSTTMLTEFEDFHRPGRDCCWISISRSGDSPEGVALLERALERRPRMQHLVITCNQQGAMAQLCGRNPDRALALVLDESVNDRGLAMTSSFTNMLLAGQCVANLERLEEFGEVVGQLSELGRRFLPVAAETAAAITQLGCSRAWFVGSGLLQAVANESALKVMELTSGRVAAMSESALGLRHGPMSSVDANTAFVFFLSTDAGRRGYELDLLREIDRKRLGRVRAVVTANETEDVAALADYCLSLEAGPGFSDEYRPALDVMLGQLQGLFASMSCGLKPDQPSPNGAITRVVSPIKLYV